MKNGDSLAERVCSLPLRPKILTGDRGRHSIFVSLDFDADKSTPFLAVDNFSSRALNDALIGPLKRDNRISGFAKKTT